MKDYILKKKPDPASNEMVSAFVLGKGSIGEAVRHGNEFLHKASLLIRAAFPKIKRGCSTCAEAPYGSHRLPCGWRLGSSQPLTPPDWF